mmetsp:Transcript_86680/g.240371  ORF Transcript_86680/g.240371 Transcript_86680/m.240371 type:complete len:587 (-) Transcript_86680:65-1825(-)
MDFATEWCSTHSFESMPLTASFDFSDQGSAANASASSVKVSRNLFPDDASRDPRLLGDRQDACWSLVVCRMATFALGGLATASLLWWQCAPSLASVVSQGQLEHEQRQQQQHAELLKELQQRLHGLQLRRQLLGFQRQPGRQTTPAEADLPRYCQALQRVVRRRSRQPRSAGGRAAAEANVAAGAASAVDRPLLDHLVLELGRLERMGGPSALSAAPAPVPVPAAPVIGGVASGRRLAGSNGRRWAFVMMAHDPPGDPIEHLWNVVPIARALQRLSAFPLVLLTNQTHFHDGSPVVDGLRKLNVQVRPVYQLDMPPRLAKRKMTRTWKVAYWKLQIWTLTEFEKLIWLDSDAIVFRGLDWLFERDWMYAQRDDWFCKLKQPHVCSGLMLVFPNKDDYKGLLEYAETLPELPGGDQQLIAQYFEKTNRPINLLSDLEASFGQCIGSAPTPYLNPDGERVWGVWSVPNFVHKSGGWGNTNNNEYNNVCFGINITLQRYVVGNTVVNACQFHALGPYWRDLFCDAASHMGIRIAEVAVFCDDRCWYQGVQPEIEGDVDSCGPLNGTLRSSAYYGKQVGWPVHERPNLVI